MKYFDEIVGKLIKDYGISSQQRLLRLGTQLLDEVKMSQNIIILENIHIHPHGVNHSLKHHKHHFMEIHIPFSGAGFVYAEDLHHPFRAGEFTANPPEQIHYWEMSQAPLPMLILWLRLEHHTESPDPQDQLLIDFFETQQMVHPLPPAFFIPYRELLAELSSPRIGMEIALKNQLSQIILILARAAASPSQIEQKIVVEPKGRDERLIFMVDQFLKDNLAREFVTEDIARQMSLSTRSLIRKYREIKGRSIGEELSRLRMYQAEEMLRESDLPIKAIAFECGFPDPRYFARKFKKFYNSNPSEYRTELDPT